MHTIARFVLALSLGLAATACSVTSSDDASASAQDLTAYDSVVTHGTKVETDDTRNDHQSAKTRVIGFMKSRAVDASSKQMSAIAHWTDIKADDGTRAFSAARVVSDHTTGSTRTITAKVTLADGVAIDVSCTVRPLDDGTTSVKIVNTTGYEHWLAGTVLKPNGIVIDAKLVSYQDGVIFDATMRVKLETMEERAAGLAATLPEVFTWLDKTTPR